MSYLFIFLTIAFTVYGQMIIKWQASLTGGLPPGGMEKIWYLCRFLLNPWVLSAFASAFLASLAWIGAVSKLPLSHAYPFMSLAFVLVLILSGLFFQESITLPKIIGMALIITGIVVSSQG
jgi:multidrug transporter EmrE-like cation transporter